jgi:pimeloyl-ACP methyl ester carboxylesterase
MVTSQTLTLADGRIVGYADYGPSDGIPVIWCHGGPGSRFAPPQLKDAGAEGLRIIGIDRPGYGLSTPKPGRMIGEWVHDALAVADALDIGKFFIIGASTGGAYALAVGAHVPQRVLGVIAICAMTDMRFGLAKAQMMADLPVNAAVWTAYDRWHAIAVALELLGADGSKGAELLGTMILPPADMAVLMSGAYTGGSEEDQAGYAQGVLGLVDDRLADGGGWTSFDVGRISSPVIVLHGERDSFVAPFQAAHTASLVPGARLQMVPDLGHLSIVSEVIPALKTMLVEAQ